MSGKGGNVIEATRTRTGQVWACTQAIRKGVHSEVYK